MSKFILVTADWTGFGLALLAKQQGSDVIAAFDHGKVKDEYADQTELIGDGLVDKIPLDEALHKLIMRGNLWVFDNNELPTVAERLRKAGEHVIGTSALSAKLEGDRDYAVGIADSAGLKSPETEKFTDYDAAVKFLEANKDKSYVYKPFKGDATSTYVPQEREDLSKANEELREYIGSLSEGSPRFILQEVVEGIEAAFDLWLRDGKPVASFLDLESKRKMTGDLGENIGCAGGYVTKISPSSRGIKETIGKYLRLKEIEHYTGSADVNVIITKKGPLFLENCFRFGYAAYPAMFHSLAKASVEDILWEWLEGKGKVEHLFSEGFAGSLVLTSDNIKEGSPLLIPESIVPRVDVYRAYSEEKGRLCLVEGWPEICAVTSSGGTIENASRDCLKLAGMVSFPDKGYRIDLGQANLPTLPLARYRALRATGWL